MKLTWFVPIFEWSKDPTFVHGIQFGVTMYRDLQDLYGFENQDGKVIGYFEVYGTIPSKEEFEASKNE